MHGNVSAGMPAGGPRYHGCVPPRSDSVDCTAQPAHVPRAGQLTVAAWLCLGLAVAMAVRIGFAMAVPHIISDRWRSVFCYGV